MKTFIPNRDNNKICVLVENAILNDKLAFVMHGLSGNKEQLHIRAIVEVLLEDNYTVITWDAVHTFGESTGGLFEDATITNYYSDLEDVITWAGNQDWYIEPFVLVGHSLGGISTALYAENYPSKVKALAPISTLVSGELSLVIKKDSEIADWKESDIQITMSHDGTREKRLRWNHMEDRLKYDLIERVDKLTMPTLLVVGDADSSTPPEHQQLLFDKLRGQKEYHIIKGAEHSFYEQHERDDLKQIFKEWLSKF